MRNGQISLRLSQSIEWEFGPFRRYGLHPIGNGFAIDVAYSCRPRTTSVLGFTDDHIRRFALEPHLCPLRKFDFLHRSRIPTPLRETPTFSPTGEKVFSFGAPEVFMQAWGCLAVLQAHDTHFAPPGDWRSPHTSASRWGTG